MADLTLVIDAVSNPAQASFAALGKSILEFGKDSLKAFQESERATRQLSLVAGNLTGAFQRQASAMQRSLGVSDEMVMSMQTMALRFGAAPSQVEGLTKAVLDYASATGEDATSAMRKVMVGVEAGGRGLNRLGIQFKSTGDQTKDLAALTASLGAMYGGAAGSDADSLAGKARIAAEQFESLKETFGGFIDKVAEKSGAMDLLIETMEKLNYYLSDDAAKVNASTMYAQLASKAGDEAVRLRDVVDSLKAQGASIEEVGKAQAKLDAAIKTTEGLLSVSTKANPYNQDAKLGDDPLRKRNKKKTKAEEDEEKRKAKDNSANAFEPYLKRQKDQEREDRRVGLLEDIGADDASQKRAQEAREEGERVDAELTKAGEERLKDEAKRHEVRKKARQARDNQELAESLAFDRRTAELKKIGESMAAGDMEETRKAISEAHAASAKERSDKNASMELSDLEGAHQQRLKALLRQADEIEQQQEAFARAGSIIGGALTNAIADAIAQIGAGEEVDVEDSILSVLPGLTQGILTAIPATAAFAPFAGALVGGITGGIRAGRNKEKQAAKLAEETAKAKNTAANAKASAPKTRKYHDGGWVEPKTGAEYHASGWENALRFHNGGEVPALLLPGERVLSHKEVSNMGGMGSVDRQAKGGSEMRVYVSTLDSTSFQDYLGHRGGSGAVRAIASGKGEFSQLIHRMKKRG